MNGLYSYQTSRISGNSYFINSISFILKFGRICGYLPLQIDKSGNARFKWKSFWPWYSVVQLIFSIIHVIILILAIVQTQAEINVIVVLYFYFVHTISGFMFLKLARNWRTIADQWNCLEQQLLKINFGNSRTLKQTKKFISKLMITYLILCLVEVFNTRFFGMYTKIRYCFGTENLLFNVLIMAFYTHLKILPYNLWSMIYLNWTHMYGLMLWLYVDGFVTVLSIHLAAMFRCINKTLEEIGRENKILPTQWESNRRVYLKLCEFSRYLDKNICVFTFNIYIVNLFFVVIQLFNGIQSSFHNGEAVYYWFSMVFLTLRIIIVTLFGSEVRNESKKTLQVIQQIDVDLWSKDTLLFIENIKNESIALTGFNLFVIDRKILLSIFAAFITYELVLFQLSSNRLAGPENYNQSCTLEPVKWIKKLK